MVKRATHRAMVKAMRTAIILIMTPVKIVCSFVHTISPLIKVTNTGHQTVMQVLNIKLKDDSRYSWIWQRMNHKDKKHPLGKNNHHMVILVFLMKKIYHIIAIVKLKMREKPSS